MTNHQNTDEYGDPEEPMSGLEAVQMIAVIAAVWLYDKLRGLFRWIVKP